MRRVDEYDRIVSSAYEAVLSPDRLVSALDAMTRFLDGDTCHLVGWDRSTLEPVLSLACGLPDEIGPEYAAHYTRLDPRLQLSFRMAPGASLACHKHFTPEFVSRSEFYQDYLIPHTGLHYLLGATDLVPGGQDLLVVGLHRHVGHAHFSDEEIGWFERFVPHFSRVLRILTEQSKDRWSSAVKDVTDRLSHMAVFALDEAGRVVEANACADAVLQTNDLFVLSQGKIKTAAHDQEAAFDAKFRLALGGSTECLTLVNSTRERRLCVTLLPAPERPLPTLSTRRLAVLMIACDTTPKRVASVTQLMEFFKLTAAEARLARALCRGEDVQSYAVEEELKVSTVRSHLKAAMEKTGTSAQRDLVRVILTIPPVR